MVTQAAEHADELVCLGVKTLKCLIVKEALFLSDKPLTDQFVKRANSEFDEAGKVLPRRPRTSFGDVGGNRNCSSAHLTREAEPLIGWKIFSEAVDKRCELDRPSPDIELLEVEFSFLFF